MVCQQICQCEGCVPHRPWAGLCHLPGGQLEDEGSQLCPFRGVCGRRAEARYHQPHRGRYTGGERSHPERSV